MKSTNPNLDAVTVNVPDTANPVLKVTIRFEASALNKIRTMSPTYKFVLDEVNVSAPVNCPIWNKFTCSVGISAKVAP